MHAHEIISFIMNLLKQLVLNIKCEKLIAFCEKHVDKHVDKQKLNIVRPISKSISIFKEGMADLVNSISI